VTVSSSPSRPVTRTRAPGSAPSSHRARHSSPCTRTYPTGRHSCATSTTRPSIVSAPTRPRACRVPEPAGLRDLEHARADQQCDCPAALDDAGDSASQSVATSRRRDGGRDGRRPAGDAVGVEAFEQELCHAAPDPEQVAEAREGDPAGRRKFRPALPVRPYAAAPTTRRRRAGRVRPPARARTARAPILTGVNPDSRGRRAAAWRLGLRGRAGL
jgi:hypothetical protein